MNEEVANREVNFAVQTSKLTLRVILKALHAINRRVHDKKQIRDAVKDHDKHGKQSVKDLIGQGDGVSSMDIGDAGTRDFKRIANKYGVDFAIVKDKTGDKPQYTVFFKARDADAISQVIKEVTNKQKARTKDPNIKKESILDKLKKFKEIVAKIPHPVKEKFKEKER